MLWYTPVIIRHALLQCENVLFWSTHLSSVCPASDSDLGEIHAKFCYLYWEIGVAEQEYDIKFSVRGSKIAQMYPKPQSSAK